MTNAIISKAFSSGDSYLASIVNTDLVTVNLPVFDASDLRHYYKKCIYQKHVSDYAAMCGSTSC